MKPCKRYYGQFDHNLIFSELNVDNVEYYLKIFDQYNKSFKKQSYGHSGIHTIVRMFENKSAGFMH